MATHYDEIANHERHERAVGGIWALLLILVMFALTIGVLVSLFWGVF